MNRAEGVIDLAPYPRPELLSAEERTAATDALLKWLLRERGMIAAFSATTEKKRALVRADFVQAHAAELLGISRSLMQYKLKKYNITGH